MIYLLQNSVGGMMRIEGALRYFDSFSNCLGESSRVILNKSPIVFLLYRTENGIGDRSSQEHLKNPKLVEVLS